MSNLLPYRHLTNSLMARPLGEIRKDLNRLWESPDAFVTAYWTPSVDVRETSESMEFSIDLPGVRREDVSIEVDNHTLFVKGVRHADLEEREGTYHRIEKVYGAFERVFRLPTALQTDMVRAHLKDGILHVAIPKSEQARRKQVAIEVDS